MTERPNRWSGRHLIAAQLALYPALSALKRRILSTFGHGRSLTIRGARGGLLGSV